MVTASTLYKRPFFQGDERLQLVQQALWEAMEAFGWRIQAWAIFANHYHVIAHAPSDAASLKRVIQRLHAQTAREINRLDKTPGRQVWFQYWDTCLTFEASYYARLSYVHHNPVKHGLVTEARHYPFCSAAWFEQQADPALRRKVETARYDRVTVPDDF